MSMVIALLLIVAQAQGGTAQWKQHVSTEGGYVASFPGEPKTTEVLPQQEGATLVHMARLDTAASFFMIIWNDVPWMKGGAADMLKTVLDGLRASPNKLISEQDIALGPIPGKELRIMAADGTVMLNRVYADATRRRLYQVMFGPVAESQSSRERDEFFGSFRLTQK
jgi:hypothetical protein